MERDLAFVLSRDVQSQNVVDTIKQIDRKLISDVFIFDVYQGENVQDDQKSLAVRVVFSSQEPLSEEMIQPKMNKIIKVLHETYQAVLRS
jgi:phenylalanyl-tRNA synthetase beta chain